MCAGWCDISSTSSAASVVGYTTCRCGAICRAPGRQSAQVDAELARPGHRSAPRPGVSARHHARDVNLSVVVQRLIAFRTDVAGPVSPWLWLDRRRQGLQLCTRDRLYLDSLRGRDSNPDIVVQRDVNV